MDIDTALKNKLDIMEDITSAISNLRIELTMATQDQAEKIVNEIFGLIEKSHQIQSEISVNVLNRLSWLESR
jgi:hypothetical protein